MLKSTGLEVECWMIVRKDDQGKKMLVKKGLAEAAADREIRYFEEAAGGKPHKNDYYKISYTQSMFAEVIAREKIFL